MDKKINPSTIHQGVNPNAGITVSKSIEINIPQPVQPAANPTTTSGSGSITE